MMDMRPCLAHSCCTMIHQKLFTLSLAYDDRRMWPSDCLKTRVVLSPGRLLRLLKKTFQKKKLYQSVNTACPPLVNLLLGILNSNKPKEKEMLNHEHPADSTASAGSFLSQHSFYTDLKRWRRCVLTFSLQGGVNNVRNADLEPV